MTGERETMPNHSVWHAPACLKRAAGLLKQWTGKTEDAPALVHAALELQLALELYTQDRYEQISGELPETRNLHPDVLLIELAKFNEEAMTPQTWSVSGIVEDHRGNAAAFTALGYQLLKLEKTRQYYVQLSELLHAGLRYDAATENPAFWEKQYQTLRQIHTELETLLGDGAAKPDAAAKLFDLGQQQAGIL